MTMQPHQLALVEQAIQRASGRYDEATSLLQLADHEGFGVVLESLCLAVLLLLRPSTERTRRALRLVDAVLETQHKAMLDSEHGAFPLTWSTQNNRGLVVEDDSREAMGSLLARLVDTQEAVLGEARSARMRDAVRRTIRPADHPQPADAAGLMLAAWLDLEFGDRWRSQRLVEQLRSADAAWLVGTLMADPRKMALALWAASLWQSSARLRDDSVKLLEALSRDIAGSVHPTLPEFFGDSTRSSRKSEDVYPWLGSWLTWHALGATPLLPTALREPLQAPLFAFPALAELTLPAEAAVLFAREAMDGPIQRALPQRTVTGWSESDLLIEASENYPGAQCGPGAGTPVVGVSWRAGDGASAWLQCRVSRTFSARCSKRFVHLDDPGLTTIDVGQLGPGGTRMIEQGWWLSGLHFSTQGFEMTDAIRTLERLTLKLKPTDSQPMLMFAPLV
jgi:hypothetical protein